MSGFDRRGRVIRNSSEDPLLTNVVNDIPFGQTFLYAADGGTAWKKLKSDLQRLGVSLYAKNVAAADAAVRVDADGCLQTKIGGDSAGTFVQAKVGPSANPILGVNNNALFANAVGYQFDGTDLQLVGSAWGTQDNSTRKQHVLCAADMIYDETVAAFQMGRSARSLSDADSGKFLRLQGLSAFNGSGYDRWRNNVDVTLLASGARAVFVNSSNQVNYNARGIVLVLDVTVVSGTGGLTPRVECFPAIGSAYALWVAAAAITATGSYVYVLYPTSAGLTAGPVKESVNTVLPRTWRLQVNVGDASSYTYSASAAFIL